VSAVLAARRLSKAYGQRRALIEASISIEPGEFIGVLGPSGSGKTTLFRCLMRLVEPDAGEIEVAGERFDRLRGGRLARARRRIGVVFQQFNLIRRLSALENVLAARLATTPLWRVLLRNFSDDDYERAARALADVGLSEHLHQRADTLSGGQQQRVAIARAFAQESAVILADEPVSNLDPATAQSVLEIMRRLAKERGTAVLCTLHQTHFAEQFSDRIIIMEAGRIMAERAPQPSRPELMNFREV